jgi:trigger factor
VPKAVTVDDKAVDATLKDLQRMQTKESSVDREVREHDKVVVDMDLSADNVPLEGGQARDHGIYLDEEYYIPGLKEQVLGLKKGDKKTFKLRFPQTHYQKHLAGREVDFAVTVKDVLQLDHPALDDAFARTLGQENLAKIRELIRGNIKEEADEKEKQRTELEALDKLVEKSKFEEIPEIMIATEVDRMIGELRENLGKRGVEFPEYLTNIKKTEADLRVEFAPQAVKRVKTALVIREVGTKERIEVTDADVLSEVQKLMNAYSGNADVQAQLRTDDYQAYLRSTLRNRKVVDLLRETATKQ